MRNSKILNYILQLNQLYHGRNWLEESFEKKLGAITEAEAFKPPAPNIHSVAEIVWHCLYWRVVTLKRMQGDTRYRDETMEQLNFLPLEELKKKGWKTLLAELQDSQQQLVEFLKDKTDDFLEVEYLPGKTNRFQLEGVIQHDAYHLGQVGLVVKMNRM